MSKIYHVVATARNRVIGRNNQLPWHFSEDLKYFKKLTMGSAVIMGRKTFESIYEATKGKLLPGREMIVLTRQGMINIPPESLKQNSVPVIAAKSIGEAYALVHGPQAFIIGGEEIYKNTIHYVDGIYLTRIAADYDGDAFYPEVPDEFEEIEIQGLREKDPKIDIVFYEKKENVSMEEKTDTNEGTAA